MGKGLRLPAHIGCAGKTNFIVQLPLYMAERSGCEVCRREDRQVSNLLEIPKYFCLSRAAVRCEPVGAGLVLRRCPVSRPGNKFWSGSDAFSVHHPLQAGFGLLLPDPESPKMAILASQIAATGALPYIPAIMRHRNQVQNT